MEFFASEKSKIDLIKRLDYNFWSPRKSFFNEDVIIKPLNEWIGSKNNLTTSAFYPSITPYYQSQDDEDNLLPFIRVGDTRKLLLEYNETVFLNIDLLNKLIKNIKRVEAGDIVITKGGEYIGEASLVPDYYDQYAISRDVLAVRTRDSDLSGEYLTSFFRSGFGKSEIIRTRSVQGQPHLTLNKFSEINVPYFGDDFEMEVKEYWESFYSLIKESDEHLENAKKMFDSFLFGLLNEKEDLTTFSKELDKTTLSQRMDFNYYSERWSRLVRELKNRGITFENVKYIKDPIDDTDPEAIHNYITLADIDERSGIIKRHRELRSFELPDRAKRKIQLRDLLVSSLKGSKEKVAIVEEDKENLVASTGFYIIRSDSFKAEVLYLIFRSRYYDLFIEQMASGAIMSSLTEKYFKRLELPVVDDATQEKISDEIKNYLEKRAFAFFNIEQASAKFDLELLSDDTN